MFRQARAKFGKHILSYAMVNVTVYDQKRYADRHTDKHTNKAIKFGLRTKRDKQSAELSHVAAKREDCLCFHCLY